MMNETFSFQRFWNYLKYDLKQLHRNNGRAVVLLGFLSLLCYLVSVIFSLVFTGRWEAPSLAARAIIFVLGAFILVLHTTRTYGYLTEKRAGSAWLMVPASSLEKFISMVLVTVVICPVTYVLSYLSLDAVICLFDSTAGGSVLMGSGYLLDRVEEGLIQAGEEGFHFNMALLLIPAAIQFIYNILYFLLCGISFKKWKLVGSFAVLLVVEIAIVSLVSFMTSHFAWLELYLNVDASNPADAIAFLNGLMNWGTAINLLILAGMGAGVYYRIKTLKH